MDKNTIKRRYYLMTAVVFACLVVCVILYFYMGYSAYDVKGHWRICRYTLLGYDPFPLIGKKAILDSVGRIPKGFSTVPWSCTLGNVFYGGFLPVTLAKIYIWVLHFVVYGVTAVVIWRKFGAYLKRKELLLLVLLIGAHFSFMYSLRFGNAGAIICCLIILSICIVDTHPWLSGICIGLAMTKPQIAAIICLVYLLNWKWKPLVIGAVMDLAGWAATGIITKTSPFLLLKETFSSGTASDKQYLGLLSVMQAFGWNKTVILILNVMIGILYTILLWRYLKKRVQPEACRWLLYAPACIASTFWIYKNGTDYLILVYAAACFLILCLKQELKRKDFWIALFSMGYLQMSRCLVYAGVLLVGETSWGRDLFKSIDGLLLGIAGVILCRLCSRYLKKENS